MGSIVPSPQENGLITLIVLKDYGDLNDSHMVFGLWVRTFLGLRGLGLGLSLWDGYHQFYSFQVPDLRFMIRP